MALEAGADTVMDLSIAGDLMPSVPGMLAACPRPLGTVPMYSVGQQILDNDRDIASMRLTTCSPRSKNRPARAWTS